MDNLIKKRKEKTMAKKNVKSVSGEPKKKFRWFNNPGKTGERFCCELHNGENMITGEKLTDRQKAYRAGYTASRADSAHAYSYRKDHPKE
jgi:hypothetical protein